MQLKVNFDEQRILAKVNNDNFGKFISKTWKDLIDPYTPRDTGMLMGASGATVSVEPWRLHYLEHYGTPVYYGEHMNFQKKNPYSTHHWDIAAAQAGQLNKLYTAANSYLNSGR